MPRNTQARLKIWGALLISASLVSCSNSPASQHVSGPSNDPSFIASPEHSPSASTSVATNEHIAEHPSVTKVPISTLPDEESPSPEPVVEVSTIQPERTEEALPPETSFQPNSPSLGSLALGATDKEVFKQYGLPADTYPLPGDNLTIEIWEYDGFSVGLNANNQVVYVEIISSDVNTGIKGLLSGMDGSKAAQLLGIATEDQTNVLAVEVTGGWLKLDLDPDTQQVLSIKLLSKDI